MSKQKNVHYVNNKEFHEALTKYKTKLNLAREEYFNKHGKYPAKNEIWEQRPRISNYLGDCFLKIATHLSYLPKFVNYMYRDEMVSDAVENCSEYIHNFDVNRTNPFAYFTQICYYAFLRRISREKRQVEIREKLIERSSFDEVFTADEHYSSSDYNSIKDAIQSKYH